MDLIEIIKHYLQIKTNYAVIVRGDYGIGKTHFFKNILTEEIKKIPLPKNDKKSYYPIHLSLFGKKNIEEIQAEIFFSLFTFFNSKNTKLTAGIVKALFRGAASITKLGDIDKYISDIKPTNHLISFEELVLFFDDFDRISKSLDLNEVFGFINSLVENEGCKVIIIANEKELLNNESYKSDLKEKVINVAIEFTPNIHESYDQIIAQYSSPEKSYFDFLNTSKNIITNAIQKNSNNLRSLLYFLEHFKIIYYSLESEFQTDTDFLVCKADKIQAVLNFALAVSLEYKIGNLNLINFEDINIKNHSTLEFSYERFVGKSNSESKETEKSYWDKFKEKYFNDLTYYYFDSILKYLTGQEAFKLKNLKIELENYFIVENGEVPEHQKILLPLDWRAFTSLSDKEYKRLTFEMLTYVDAGKYNLDQYVNLFKMALRFDNMLNLDLPKLVKRFKNGIRKGVANYTYNYHLNFHLSVSSEPAFKTQIDEIIHFCLKINDDILKKSNENKLQSLFNLFQKDFKSFLNDIYQLDNEWRSTPFWSLFNFDKAYRRILELNNDEIIDLSYYFLDRYRKHIYDKIYPEKHFLMTLKEKLEKKIGKKKSIRNGSIKVLISNLEKSIINFP